MHNVCKNDASLLAVQFYLDFRKAKKKNMKQDKQSLKNIFQARIRFLARYAISRCAVIWEQLYFYPHFRWNNSEVKTFSHHFFSYFCRYLFRQFESQIEGFSR